jgi:hypothetical protein
MKAKLALNANEIIKVLAQLEKHRASLYLSSQKMEHWYLQKVSQIRELGTDEALLGKLKAGLPWMLEAGAESKKGTESKVAIEKDIVQGIVAENAARVSKTLVDLTSGIPKKGELLYYAGPARISMMNATLSAETNALNSQQCSTVNAERNSQEAILKAFDSDDATIVLTFTTNSHAFASIASRKCVYPSPLSSYHAEETFGILGTLESTQGGVFFLDPLWIWH